MTEHVRAPARHYRKLRSQGFGRIESVRISLGERYWSLFRRLR